MLRNALKVGGRVTKRVQHFHGPIVTVWGYDDEHCLVEKQGLHLFFIYYRYYRSHNGHLIILIKLSVF